MQWLSAGPLSSASSAGPRGARAVDQGASEGEPCESSEWAHSISARETSEGEECKGDGGGGDGGLSERAREGEGDCA